MEDRMGSAAWTHSVEHSMEEQCQGEENRQLRRKTGGEREDSRWAWKNGRQEASAAWTNSVECSVEEQQWKNNSVEEKKSVSCDERQEVSVEGWKTGGQHSMEEWCRVQHAWKSPRTQLGQVNMEDTTS